MKERRKHDRFTYHLPVRIKVLNSGNGKVLDLVTKDISASGAYFATLTSFPEGTRFKLDFTSPTDDLQGFRDIESLKKCTGRLVRSTNVGIAIQFDKECLVESL